MKKRTRRSLIIAAGMLTVFVLWTVSLGFVDVGTIGPQGSAVGYATVNQFVHRFTGVHMALYTLTDWLGLVPIGFGMGFAILGLVQWIRRRHLLQVDRSILLLGGFYVVVAAVYVFFEIVVINYRPILIENRLEASYPSSTTMLTLCVMATAILQLRGRIQNATVKRWITCGITAFMLFMVIGRLLSGVHWVTDIMGGGLLSGGLVALYDAMNSIQSGNKHE